MPAPANRSTATMFTSGKRGQFEQKLCRLWLAKDFRWLAKEPDQNSIEKI